MSACPETFKPDVRRAVGQKLGEISRECGSLHRALEKELGEESIAAELADIVARVETLRGKLGA